MSACDRRAYYPSRTGLFKIRSSDGDIVWECRPVTPGGTTTESSHNTRADILPSGVVVISGETSSRTSKILLVTESGGLVSSLAESGDTVEDFRVAAAIGDQLYAYDRTDDYLYHGGRDIPFFSSTLVLSRFSHAGAWEGTRSISGAFSVMRAVAGTDDFDLQMTSGSVSRFSGIAAGAATLTLSNAGRAWDSRNRIISDGTYYYFPQNSFNLRKVTIATLTVATSKATPVAVGGIGDVRNSLLVMPGSDSKIYCWETGALGLQFAVAHGYANRVTGLSACADFVASVGIDNGSGFVATLSSVKRFELDGTVTWTRQLMHGADRGSPFDLHNKVLISQDKTRVYVYGPLSHNGITDDSLKMALYCLDADDGSIVWCFSDRGGMSLHDDGDYLYLSTVSGTAPLYR